jgi:predicted Fe-Mo cluster-binding NifX family protein
MNICIPVNEDRGLQSPVCMHFGSAPMFMLVALDDDACRVLSNLNQHHEHGQCAPLAALQGESIDSMIVGGIGNGALGRLINAGIRVYMAEGATVADVMRAYRAGALRPMSPDMSCAHHGHGAH